MRRSVVIGVVIAMSACSGITANLKRVERMDDRMGAMNEHLGTNLPALVASIDSMQTRIASMDEKMTVLSQLEREMHGVGGGVTSMDGQLGDVAASVRRLDELDTQLRQVNHRLVSLEHMTRQLQQVNAQLGELQAVVTLAREADGLLRWKVAAGVGVLLVIALFLLTHLRTHALLARLGGDPAPIREAAACRSDIACRNDIRAA